MDEHVPSQDEKCTTCSQGRYEGPFCSNGFHRNPVFRIRDLEAHLSTIRSYVKNMQVVLITREDMHDPMKAQTYYDEHEGLGRLILSEIGGER